MPTTVISRHASDELRSAFIQSIDQGVADPALAAQLRRCTDIMLRSLCGALEVPQGSSYAKGARLPAAS